MNARSCVVGEEVWLEWRGCCTGFGNLTEMDANGSPERSLNWSPKLATILYPSSCVSNERS